MNVCVHAGPRLKGCLADKANRLMPKENQSLRRRHPDGGEGPSWVGTIERECRQFAGGRHSQIRVAVSVMIAKHNLQFSGDICRCW